MNGVEMERTEIYSIPKLVDTHVHFFDKDMRPGLTWDWLSLDQPQDLLSYKFAASALARFTSVELFALGYRFAGLRKAVHVQAAIGSEDPVSETRWLDALHRETGSPSALIAYAPIHMPNGLGVIAEHSEFNLMRGVRCLDANGAMAESTYQKSVMALGRNNMILEVYCRLKRFEALFSLARRCSETTIVLEHFGGAPSPSNPEFHDWRRGLRELSRCPNIHLKMSGIALTQSEWTVEDVCVLVNESLEAFGVTRCVVGSNFPIDSPSCAYPDYFLAVSVATKNLSPSERLALFADNAESLYRI